MDDSLDLSSPESLSVSLSLEDAAHEELQRSAVKLCSGHIPLASRLAVQSEHLPQLVLSRGPGPIDLVAEDEDGTVAELLVSQQRLQLYFALAEPELLVINLLHSAGEDSPGSVAAVDQEHDGVHRGEIVLPDPPRLVMTSQIESGES